MTAPEPTLYYLAIDQWQERWAEWMTVFYPTQVQPWSVGELSDV